MGKLTELVEEVNKVIGRLSSWSKERLLEATELSSGEISIYREWGNMAVMDGALTDEEKKEIDFNLGNWDVASLDVRMAITQLMVKFASEYAKGGEEQ